MLMERTEPTLVPEWLRCTGNVAGSGSLVQHSDASSANSARSRSFRSNGEKDGLRRLDRSSSFDSRSSSISNGSTKHPYSSFSRSHKDKRWDRDKGKPLSDGTWYRDSSEYLVSTSNRRNESSSLRHSHSWGSRKPGEALPHKAEGSRTGNDGVFKGSSNLSVTQKGVFEKNFPLLGKEEKKTLARTGAGLSSPSHILPFGDTGFLGEKWTSALAEVPVNNEANVTVHSSLQKNFAFSNSLSGVSTTSVLNMAETLSQPAVGTREALQLTSNSFDLPDKSQRLEELAIKHCRQLIPVTPSMPKPLVPSLGDKLKQRKPTLSSGATAEASRIVHPLSHSSHRAYQSHTGQIRHDSTTTSHVGKFLVLKSSRENGTTTSARNGSIADNDVHGESMHLSSLKAPTVLSTSTVSALGKRTAALSLNSASNLDKRTSQSLVQSRSEFFNLMRKKNSSDPSSGGSHAKAETLESTGDLVLENSDRMRCNGDSHRASENRKDSSDSNGFDYTCGSVYPDEEEAAFLRSLGWEENGGEDEGLTEEEINAFYEEYVHKTPTLKLCRGFQPKCSTLAKLQSISGSDATTKTEPGA